MKPLIAIVGNTGVGKSQFAVELAKALNGEVINGDAMQMYQGLDVMTNKHPVSARDGIPHHFIGTEPWEKQLTVQDFESKAVDLVDGLHAQHKTPILVGGTHYYIQSLIAENSTISQSPQGSSSDSPSLNVTEKSLSEQQREILDDPIRVDALLKEVDPVIAAKFHPNDTRRLRRALEIWFETGKKPSDIYESQQSGIVGEKLQLRYRVLIFWIWCNKSVLDARLDARVADMVNSNLLGEVKQLYSQYDSDEPQRGIFQVLGFRQFLPYLQSPTEENLALGVDSMKTETRQYAKKQSKWIRNKLLPMIDKLEGTYALLDSSDIDRFDVDVTQRGINIANNWLSGSVDPELLVPSNLIGETQRRREAFTKGQWVRHRCAECSKRRDTEVIIIGDEDWHIHLNSKQHRYSTRKKFTDNVKVD